MKILMVKKDHHVWGPFVHPDHLQDFVRIKKFRRYEILHVNVPESRSWIECERITEFNWVIDTKKEWIGPFYSLNKVDEYLSDLEDRGDIWWVNFPTI